MPVVKFQLNIPNNANMEQIADVLARFQRELEWLLNGNLDSSNMKTTFTKDVTFTKQVLIGDNGVPIGASTMTDSTAVNVTALRDDFNTLLGILRSYNIL